MTTSAIRFLFLLGASFVLTFVIFIGYEIFPLLLFAAGGSSISSTMRLSRMGDQASVALAVGFGISEMLFTLGAGTFLGGLVKMSTMVRDESFDVGMVMGNLSVPALIAGTLGYGFAHLASRPRVP